MNLYQKLFAKASHSCRHHFHPSVAVVQNINKVDKTIGLQCSNHFSSAPPTTLIKTGLSPYSIEEITVPNGHQYGYQIACKVWRGEGASSTGDEPPIVCVHGWLDNANTFDALLPKLMRPGRTFYAFDLPGHGFSSHIHNSHYNSHVESHLGIHRIARYLNVDKISLMGHSMGGEASIMFAGSFPEYVHKLIAIDGVCPNFHDWPLSTKLFVNSLLEVEGILAKSPTQSPTTFDQLLKRMMKAREGMVTAEGCKTLLGRGVVKVRESEDMYRFSHDLKLRMVPGMAMMTIDQMTEFCSAITASMCVIKAKENDPFSLEASQNFQTALETAKNRNNLVNVEFHVADGNHHVHLNQPNEVANIILQFLDS